MKHIETIEQFDEEIKNGVVLADFFANWCGPCKMLSPVIEEIEPRFSDIKFLKIDVDLLPELAKRYGIYSIPTLLLFKERKLEKTSLGYLNENQLMSFLNK